MQISSNPWDARDSGAFELVRRPFLCHCAQGGRGEAINEGVGPSKQERKKETKRLDERSLMKFEKNPEDGELMNGRMRVKGRLSGDKAVTNRDTERRRTGEYNEPTKHLRGARCHVLPLYTGCQRISGEKQALSHILMDFCYTIYRVIAHSRLVMYYTKTRERSQIIGITNVTYSTIYIPV